MNNNIYDEASHTIISSTGPCYAKIRKPRSFTLASHLVLICAQLADQNWAQFFGRSYIDFLLKRTTAIIIALYCATRGASLPAIEKDYSPRRHLPRFLPTKQGYPLPSLSLSTLNFKDCTHFLTIGKFKIYFVEMWMPQRLLPQESRDDFSEFGNGNSSPYSQTFGTRMGVENCIPKFWE